MSFRGEQKIKNKIYVYEATSIWNTEKRRSEQKRIYIGTKDPLTGEFLPNKKYHELYGDLPYTDQMPDQPSQEPKKQFLSGQGCIAEDYGNITFLQELSEKSGLTDALEKVFPSDYMTLCSALFYQMCTGCRDLAGYTFWAACTSGVKKCSGRELAEDMNRIVTSDLFRQFVNEWFGRHSQENGWYYVCPDREWIYTTEDLCPIWFTSGFGDLDGEADSRGMDGEWMLRHFQKLPEHTGHYILVLLQDLLTEKNMQLFLQQKIPFLARVSLSKEGKYSRIAQREVQPQLRNPENQVQVEDHSYYLTVRREMIQGEELLRYYIQDEQIYEAEKYRLEEYLAQMEQDLVAGKKKMSDPDVRRYFLFQPTREGRYQIIRRESFLMENLRDAGVFMLLTNTGLSFPECIKALDGLEKMDISLDVLSFLSEILERKARERLHEIREKEPEISSLMDLLACLRRIRKVTFTSGEEIIAGADM